MLVIGTIGIPVFTMLALLLGYVIKKEHNKRLWIRNLIIMIISVIIGGSCFLATKIMVESSYEETYKVEKYELNTLSNNEYININGKEVYVYKSKDSKQGTIYTFNYNYNGNEVEKKDILGTRVIVNEQENCTPHVEVCSVERKNDVISEKWNNILMFGMLTFDYVEYKLFVPTGTEVEIYNGQFPILVKSNNR